MEKKLSSHVKIVSGNLYFRQIIYIDKQTFQLIKQMMFKNGHFELI